MLRVLQMTVPFFPVVFFSGRSWCSYFDTTDSYLRFIPTNGQMTVPFFSGRNFFDDDSWCLYFDTTDGDLIFIPTDGQTTVPFFFGS
jgi:hypothetical protein